MAGGLELCGGFTHVHLRAGHAGAVALLRSCAAADEYAVFGAYCRPGVASEFEAGSAIAAAIGAARGVLNQVTQVELAGGDAAGEADSELVRGVVDN